MGGHYGSVQVRSSDRSAVKAVAEQVADRLKIRLLIGPAIAGWIGLYPERNGQDEGVGKQFARLTNDYVLHLLVHDDDIFAYWLFHVRRLIDSYWSAPGYFGNRNREAEEKMAGDPEAFRPLIQDRVSRLRPLLARDKTRPLFESERLAAFAKVLRISNAVQAYEYLLEEDHSRVKGWRQFEEIPAERVEAESDSARTEQMQAKAAIKRLRLEGSLLLREHRQEQIAYGCASGNGFVVAWRDHRSHTVEFSAYHQPWQSGQTILMDTPAHVAGLSSDFAGNRTAIAAGDRVQIWDSLASNPKHILDIPERDLAISVSISADGSLVVHASRQEIVVSNATSGKALLTLPIATHRQLAIHPSGDWLTAAGNTLGLISMHKDPRWRDLLIGGESPGAAAIQSLFRQKLQGIDLAAIEQQQRAAIERDDQFLQRADSRAGNKELSNENLAKAKGIMQKQMEAFRAQLVALKEGKLPPQANEPVFCTRFSRDGRKLYCGTNLGLRVYEWASVPRTSGSNMPPPVWRFDIPRDPSLNVHNHIHTMAEEVDASGLLFACGSTVFRLDLSTGTTRELIRLPGNPVVYHLVLSLDGTALGIASRDLTQPRARRGRQSTKQYWDVWSFLHLRAARESAPPANPPII